MLISQLSTTDQSGVPFEQIGLFLHSLVVLLCCCRFCYLVCLFAVCCLLVCLFVCCLLAVAVVLSCLVSVAVVGCLSAVACLQGSSHSTWVMVPQGVRRFLAMAAQLPLGAGAIILAHARHLHGEHAPLSCTDVPTSPTSVRHPRDEHAPSPSPPPTVPRLWCSWESRNTSCIKYSLEVSAHCCLLEPDLRRLHGVCAQRHLDCIRYGIYPAVS